MSSWSVQICKNTVLKNKMFWRFSSSGKMREKLYFLAKTGSTSWLWRRRLELTDLTKDRAYIIFEMLRWFLIRKFIKILRFWSLLRLKIFRLCENWEIGMKTQLRLHSKKNFCCKWWRRNRGLSPGWGSRIRWGVWWLNPVLSQAEVILHLDQKSCRLDRSNWGISQKTWWTSDPSISTLHKSKMHSPDSPELSNSNTFLSSLIKKMNVVWVLNTCQFNTWTKVCIQKVNLMDSQDHLIIRVNARSDIGGEWTLNKLKMAKNLL